MSDDDCGDKTMLGCALATAAGGTCQVCGGPTELCCNTASCRDGLTCILTVDLPRYCSAAPSDGGSG